MFMNTQEADVLKALLEKPFVNQRSLAEITGHSLGVVNRSIKNLSEEGYLDPKVKVTQKLIEWLTEAGKLGNAEAIKSLEALGVDVEEALLDEKAEFPVDDISVSGRFRSPETSFLEYIAKSVRYPQPAREQGIQGEVIVSFVVEADGTISNVQVEKGIGGGCDEEAVRVIKSMPRWKPAVKNGVAIPFKMSTPINFCLL